MDECDRAIVNHLQDGFPLESEPFKAASAAIGITEEALIGRIERMLDTGVLTRFGPLYQIERMGGRFTLAAMSVPARDFDRVAAIVNAFPEVAHNYERDHALNMWFVLATEDDRSTAAVVESIEQASGCRVLLFPKEREYFVQLMLTA
uniref:siroheme decarboxylase n=1 Tax=uncultured bacterium 888 TaxID=548896 RepID=B8R8P6_9BACT|nr:putative heme D1 biosynthesis protein NirG [uncultured bacterium 888]